MDVIIKSLPHFESDFAKSHRNEKGANKVVAAITIIMVA